MSTPRTLRDVRRRSLAAGFYAAGESLAVDLVDTIKLRASPPRDLLDGRLEAFWSAHEALVAAPAGLPDEYAVRELRDVVRRVFEAALDGRAFETADIDLLNATATSSLPALWVEQSAGGAAVVHRHVGDGNPLLAAVARSAVFDLGRVDELRRCGSPRCSMLFVSDSSTRVWCSQACGNRMRVQRSTRP